METNIDRLPAGSPPVIHPSLNIPLKWGPPEIIGAGRTLAPCRLGQ